MHRMEVRSEFINLYGGVAKFDLKIVAWPQSGQMFIAQDAGKSLQLQRSGICPSAKVVVSLLRSFEILW